MSSFTVLSRESLLEQLAVTLQQQQPGDVTLFWNQHRRRVEWLDAAGLRLQLPVWRSSCAVLASNNREVLVHGRTLHAAVVQHLSHRRLEEETHHDPVLLMVAGCRVSGFAYCFLERAARDELVEQLADNAFSCARCLARKPKAELKKCGSCKCVYYCDGDCQRADWRRHKELCLTAAAEAAAARQCVSRTGGA